ncbi:MAG: hypothetical protein CSA95_07075 [Bacteroidetes bacterium]|nr:MAG: hypothetical protein CSA95_07075 [Bacteroidota bacterium]PIE88022.1 MAG: hypothetical protein CSA04_03990 [Bacteroidota bacterium]
MDAHAPQKGISPEIRIRKNGTNSEVFDPVRRKWVALTPEERVRQYVLSLLIHHKKVPIGHIAVEKVLKFNQKIFRADAVVYNREGKPLLIVECKAPEVNITQTVFDQVFRYNLILKVPYVWVSNGKEHYFAEIDYRHKTSRFLDSLPSFETMKTK